MNSLRNKVNMIGRIGAKPEVKALTGGYQVTRFSIAINESRKNKAGEWENTTHWHNLTAWGKIAESIAKNTDKGNEIAIEGKLINKSYETKEGEKRYSTEIEISDYMVFKAKEQTSTSK
jgi:single-strand DNA-binding protein